MISTNFLRQRLKIRHLRLIRAINEMKSISLAAEQMGVTQAAVSKTKAEIEDIIGMPLFRHDLERWQPTEIGARLIDAAYLILSEIDSVNDELMHLREGVHGSVVVGIRTYALLPNLATAVARFKAIFPKIAVSLIDAPYHELMEQAERGHVDLIISPLADDEPRFKHVSVPIKAAHHMIFASRGHPLLAESNPVWRDAVQYPWCVAPIGTRTRRHLEVLLKKLDLPFPADVIETNSLVLSLALLREAQLLTVLPVAIGQGLDVYANAGSPASDTHMGQGVGERVNLPIYDIGDTVQLTWLSDRVLSPATCRLRDFLILRFNPKESRSVPNFRWTGPPVEPDSLSF
ncbi:LysR family transcriptional regulator [Mesorhizobium australicum]|uniref:DNA-binding transcriptional regulator, LysR family n=1 Tax=Mesorhizobium australicum TaxID=536018 RepID=A0A1X7NJN5_9HYPH|nr:LysR family transcriptional regulator [Mesorhizobium australicum]SMH38063.1 DNA-binding transcriptional regulator, LysR family [Mesorhizobium australicum]